MRQRWRSVSICCSSLQLPATVRAEPGWQQEPCAQSGLSVWVPESQVLEPHHCFLPGCTVAGGWTWGQTARTWASYYKWYLAPLSTVPTVIPFESHLWETSLFIVRVSILEKWGWPVPITCEQLTLCYQALGIHFLLFKCMCYLLHSKRKKINLSILSSPSAESSFPM